MIEMHRLKNVVIFVQTILCFVLSRKIIKIPIKLRCHDYFNVDNISVNEEM